MKLIFLGPPGSGKGTQAKILSNNVNIPQISTGDLFRENIKNKTELGIKAQSFMDQGYLVPDEVTNGMAKERLERNDCESGYILDGYPRTIPQAKFLDTVQNIDKVVNFELNEEEVVKRISGRRTCKTCGEMFHLMFKKPQKEGICDKCSNGLIQRPDDAPESVKVRLEVYKKQTEPLIEFYKDQGKILNVSALSSIDEIASKVKEVLEL
ncbi:adenylate kinase [archaeon]|jgi:adenylate kinase|nr:adenylate kinase [archaeon]MBT4022670.1 adenylate kinase [archaeon]MBT4273136.1 adenylate kinase [archaeon]MBT4461117.1 adenylate kinase [archaeon]MBT4858786.1 adenylate kinase [archaeon]